MDGQYCEFGGTVKKCEEWLHKNHPDMHQKLYSEGSWLNGPKDDYGTDQAKRGIKRESFCPVGRSTETSGEGCGEKDSKGCSGRTARGREKGGSSGADQTG